MTTSSPIISVRDLVRSFDKVEAVSGISFDIFPGQVTGFIGANGAGKTTTMRIMATLDMPTSGVVEIAGYDAVNFPGEVRERVGWMPDSYGTYENMSVVEYLDFFGRAFGFKASERRSRVEEVMEFTDLKTLADRMINKLSKGMGQRLCLGRTLLHDPEVLILDEPAAGLDPKARIEFKNLIRLLAKDGKTIFISSHILSELGEMCDTLVFIDQGKIVHHGSTESLQFDRAQQVLVDVQIVGDPQQLLDWIAGNPGVTLIDTRKPGARICFENDDPSFIAASLRRMIADGLEVTDFHGESRKLEDVFVDMLSKIPGNGNGDPPHPPIAVTTTRTTPPLE